MSESRLYNSLRNVFFGILRYMISFIFPFIIRTVMIKRFGNEYTGLGSLFSSILQVLNLSELGFGSAIVYSLYKPVAENDVQRISALMYLYKKIYRIAGGIILAAGIAVCPFITYFINGSYPVSMNIYLLFLLYLANTSLSYVFFGYKSALLAANQRNDVESKIQIISSLLCYALEILALLYTDSYYLYVAAMIAGTICNNLILLAVSKRMYPDIKEKGSICADEKKEIYQNAGALFGHQIDAVIINSADNIVISAFLGLFPLTVYNNYYYIMNAVLSLMIVISNSFTASIGNSVTTRSRVINYKNFKIFVYAIGNLNIFCTVMMFLLYQDFMNLWMGRSMMLPMHTVILICIMFYVRQMRRAVLVFKNACGQWKSDKFKPYISAALNLVLNIVLIKYSGINGVLLSTVICMIFIEFPWETNVVFREYFEQPVSEYIRIQIFFIVKMLAAGTVLYFVFEQFSCEGWLDFAVKLFLSAVSTGIIILILSMKDKQKTEVISVIKQVYRR